jgi:tellurite resistance protein TehA-like permease
VSQARTLWEEGREPGYQVVALGLALALSVTALDLARAGEVTALFDVVFVLACVAVALLVRPQDFFTVGVLPPLIMAAVFLLVAITRPAAIAHAQDGVVQAVVSGLSTHATALGVGYALCLACLAVRSSRTSRGRRPRPASPREHPPTSR